MDINLSCIVLLNILYKQWYLLYTWNTYSYFHKSLQVPEIMSVRPAEFWFCSLLIGFLLCCRFVVSGNVAHTLWSPCRCMTGILMRQRCRVGQQRSPADGVGITRTAGRHVRCSMTGVEAANISSQNTSTWDYHVEVKLNRSGSRVITSMSSMFLHAPTTLETWDIQARQSISLRTHKYLSNSWNSFIYYATKRTWDLLILVVLLVLSSFSVPPKTFSINI